MNRIIPNLAFAAALFVGAAGTVAADDTSHATSPTAAGVLVPELDPSRMGSAVSLLLAGAVVLCHHRRLALTARTTRATRLAA